MPAAGTVFERLGMPQSSLDEWEQGGGAHRLRISDVVEAFEVAAPLGAMGGSLDVVRLGSDVEGASDLGGPEAGCQQAEDLALEVCECHTWIVPDARGCFCGPASRVLTGESGPW